MVSAVLRAGMVAAGALLMVLSAIAFSSAVFDLAAADDAAASSTRVWPAGPRA